MVCIQLTSDLEMTGMSQMNMAELQSYVKANQAPCVLFTVSPLADNQSKSKMAYLTMTLGSKSLVRGVQWCDRDQSADY